MLYIGGQGLSAFAFGICVLVMLSQAAPLNRVLTTHHFHDLGKFLFAFLMLWAYLSFSQFLIIWSANIPEEIPHYLDRWDNSWKYLSIFIIVGHFIVPYALLLSRDLKKNSGKLRVIATWILVARAWPTTTGTWRRSCTRTAVSVTLLDVALPLALGGIFISLFVAQLGGRSLLPVNDPATRQGAASPCPLITRTTTTSSTGRLRPARSTSTPTSIRRSATSSRCGWRWRWCCRSASSTATF